MAGGLGETERLRRAILKALTGVSAPPALLPADLRESTAEKLDAAWDKEHDGRPWRRAIDEGESQPLLFAIAEYHREAALADRAFAALLDGDKTASGAYR